MNTIAKILAPVALVAASFGAQASQLSPGDLGTRAVTAGPAVATQVVAPAGTTQLFNDVTGRWKGYSHAHTGPGSAAGVTTMGLRWFDAAGRLTLEWNPPTMQDAMTVMQGPPPQSLAALKPTPWLASRPSEKQNATWPRWSAKSLRWPTRASGVSSR